MTEINLQDFPLQSDALGKPTVNISGPSTVTISTLQRCTITGLINGSNKVFTVDPILTVLMWFWNGLLQTEPDDYTYDTNTGTVTMTEAPAVGQKLTAVGG